MSDSERKPGFPASPAGAPAPMSGRVVPVPPATYRGATPGASPASIGSQPTSLPLPVPPPSFAVSPPGYAASAPVSASTASEGISHIPSVAPPEPTPDPYIGATIDGRYKIERPLGEGGMGIVYLGRHKVIDKAVAIKVLRADMARDSEITERFLREARAASAIGNPHIIDISDFGTLPDGSTYFVMEFLDGVPLSSLLGTHEPVPIMRLIHIAEQIADGLDAAHERQIIHRDLKPDNIYLIDHGSEKDFIKILDFGIAKVSSNTAAKLTRHGSVFGTPHYMSPEQAAGAPVDHRTDIYSLGVILYEMSSGRVPFDADNFMGILTQHLYQAPVPIRALVPPQDVPPGLEAIILKCLSKKPDQRYQSMTELKQDFERLRKGLVPDAVGEMMSRSGGFNVPADFLKTGLPVVPATPAEMLRRKPWPLYAGIAGVAAAVAIVVAIFAFGSLSTASMGKGATTGSSAVASSAPVAVTAAPTVAVAASAPAREVMIIADPLTSDIEVDGRKLGPSPQSVSVPAGKTLQVVVSHAGYGEQTFTLDGSELRKEVKLKQKGAKGPGAGAKGGGTPQPKQPHTGGGAEIVNPWGN